MRTSLAAALLATLAVPGTAQIAAIATDPPIDLAHPAGMEVLHIPSGGVAINGIAYTPPGAGPHPVMVILHGLPGNEKNLDLAQAARRDGWVAVVFNYRGSWGSPGRFSFANVVADTHAALAYLRTPAVARRLRADPARVILVGHSMGGWATIQAAARERELLGAVTVSAADMSLLAGLPRDRLVAKMAENSETLATTPAAMADEVRATAPAMAIAAARPRMPLLVLTSDDGLAPPIEAWAAAAAADNRRITVRHVATDHGWSDHRVALENMVLGWADRLR